MKHGSSVAILLAALSWSPSAAWAQPYRIFRAFENLGCTSSSLLKGSDGAFYATVACGGDISEGAIVKFAASGKLVVLHSFSGGLGGSNPQGDLLGDASGNLYGTTYQGGPSSVGTLYKVASNGAHTMLHGFDYSADGGFPLGALVRDSLGNLYGVTGSGGPLDEGTVFKYTPGGVFSVLHAFSFTDGQGYLPGGLTVGPDGNLYGTTFSGGPGSGGTVFKLTLDGTHSLLHCAGSRIMPASGLRARPAWLSA